MDTRIPHFDGQKDYQAYIRFLDNRKEYDAYDKKLSEHIAKFLAAAKLYGKAKDIEKKHEEAELWVKRAEHDYAEREEKLTAGEKALVNETRDRRAKMKNRETEIEQVLLTSKRDQTSREEALKARESEVGKRENAILAREKRAEQAQEAAQEAKRVADDMVKRMKAVAAA